MRREFVTNASNYARRDHRLRAYDPFTEANNL